MPKQAPDSTPRKTYTDTKILLQRGRQRARHEHRKMLFWELKNSPGTYFITVGEVLEKQVPHGTKIGWATNRNAHLLGENYSYDFYKKIRKAVFHFDFSKQETA